MTLIDIEQEAQFVYYDDKHKVWKQKTGTIAEFLKVYCAFQYLEVIDINSLKWGLLVGYGKKEEENQ